VVERRSVRAESKVGQALFSSSTRPHSTFLFHPVANLNSIKKKGERKTSPGLASVVFLPV